MFLSVLSRFAPLRVAANRPSQPAPESDVTAHVPAPKAPASPTRSANVPPPASYTANSARRFTQTDIDLARARGVAAGKSEVSAANTAAVAAATADGEIKGAAAVHARLTTILADPRIKGRERAALLLACHSPTMTPEELGAFVAEHGSPSERLGSLNQRMAQMGGPLDFEMAAVAQEPDFVRRMKARHQNTGQQQ